MGHPAQSHAFHPFAMKQEKGQTMQGIQKKIAIEHRGCASTRHLADCVPAQIELPKASHHQLAQCPAGNVSVLPQACNAAVAVAASSQSCKAINGLP